MPRPLRIEGTALSLLSLSRAYFRPVYGVRTCAPIPKRRISFWSMHAGIEVGKPKSLLLPNLHAARRIFSIDGRLRALDDGNGFTTEAVEPSVGLLLDHVTSEFASQRCIAGNAVRR